MAGEDKDMQPVTYRDVWAAVEKHRAELREQLDAEAADVPKETRDKVIDALCELMRNVRESSRTHDLALDLASSMARVNLEIRRSEDGD